MARSRRTAACLRAVRSAPGVSLQVAADAASIREKAVSEGLLQASGRHKCARALMECLNPAAYDALASRGAQMRVPGLQRVAGAQIVSRRRPKPKYLINPGPVFPPDDWGKEPVEKHTSSAGWATRELPSGSITRGQAATAAANQDNKREVAECAAVPAALAARLASDEDGAVRRIAAGHRNARPWLLEALVSDPLEVVRAAAAANPAINATALPRMAADGYDHVRAAAAAHPDCSAAMLAHLANDGAARVREAVAAHPRCPPETMKVLAAYWINSVRETLAGRDDCPLSALEALAEDSKPFVRDAARATLARIRDASPQGVDGADPRLGAGAAGSDADRPAASAHG